MTGRVLTWALNRRTGNMSASDAAGLTGYDVRWEIDEPSGLQVWSVWFAGLKIATPVTRRLEDAQMQAQDIANERAGAENG